MNATAELIRNKQILMSVSKSVKDWILSLKNINNDEEVDENIKYNTKNLYKKWDN